MQLDEESDALVDAVQAGSSSVEALVEAYTAKRKEFHVVDLKRQAVEVTALMT